MLVLLFAYLQLDQFYFDICGISYSNVSYVYIDKTGLIVWGPMNDTYMHQFNAIDTCSTSGVTETPNNAVTTRSTDIEPNFTEPVIGNLTYHCPKTSSSLHYISPIIGILSFITGLVITPNIISEKFKSFCKFSTTRVTARETNI